ncbi:MAG TPA: hypothetical protein VHC44_14610, partial [Verrucomicrobiae bacterium]|nr:hypothetical protein [Verrucomicrobiae bacterium]
FRPARALGDGLEFPVRLGKPRDDEARIGELRAAQENGGGRVQESNLQFAICDLQLRFDRAGCARYLSSSRRTAMIETTGAQLLFRSRPVNPARTFAPFAFETGGQTCHFGVVKTIRPVLLVIALLVASQCASPGQEAAGERRFADKNFAIIPPDGWTEKAKSPGAAQPSVSFQSPSQRTLLMISMSDTKLPVVMDGAFVAGFNYGFERSGGGKLVSGKFVEANGTRCYERIGELDVNGRTVTTFVRVVPLGTKFYALMAVSGEGEADQMPEVRRSMDSFHFLVKMQSEADSSAYKAGAIVGATIAFFWPVITKFVSVL